ncbi:MAG: hypothetical protein UY07_C0002G0050 [Parcubacteria group bacterium GW2011_GWA1_47_8]|nr:MAG: hypothetical protein UY07_C0002G0050 [Parcubacteria group bacterium GW2011_GWA1_47_8]
MILNFIFSNLDRIALAVWLVFFVVVLVRVFKSAWLKDIAYRWLIVVAVFLHILYGAVATWGQYVVWGKSEFTKILLSSALSPEVPFPSMLEWLRPAFDGAHGYFAFHSFQNFFLSTIALFIIVGLFLAFLVVRARYRPINFREGDIAIIALALLIAGWPGVITLLPIGLFVAVIFSLGARFFYSIERVPLPPAFLIAAPFALIFAIPILTALHLYPLLKL